MIEVLNKISGDFNDDDLHLLQSIATSVSIALENSQLYRETLSMAEHERGIRKMFQKFVPREIVDKIIHNAGEEKPLIEELKILTLLNIDIRSFSILSQKIGPQRTVAMLNHFFGCMGDIVFNHGGSSTSTWATAFWPSSERRSPGRPTPTTPSPPPWR